MDVCALPQPWIDALWRCGASQRDVHTLLRRLCRRINAAYDREPHLLRHFQRCYARICSPAQPRSHRVRGSVSSMLRVLQYTAPAAIAKQLSRLPRWHLTDTAQRARMLFSCYERDWLSMEVLCRELRDFFTHACYMTYSEDPHPAPRFVQLCDCDAVLARHLLRHRELRRAFVDGRGSTRGIATVFPRVARALGIAPSARLLNMCYNCSGTP
jgi:hypothetical protein